MKRDGLPSPSILRENERERSSVGSFCKEQSEHLSKYRFLTEKSSENPKIIRTSLTRDLPEIFSGTVEVDETYLGVNGK